MRAEDSDSSSSGDQHTTQPSRKKKKSSASGKQTTVTSEDEEDIAFGLDTPDYGDINIEGDDTNIQLQNTSHDGDEENNNDKEDEDDEVEPEVIDIGDEETSLSLFNGNGVSNSLYENLNS